MSTFILILTAIYIGIAVYEFYISMLQGQPIRECFINALVWPVEVYYTIKDSITNNYIDKDGP